MQVKIESAKLRKTNIREITEESSKAIFLEQNRGNIQKEEANKRARTVTEFSATHMSLES